MKKKTTRTHLTVTVGIPTLNSQDNIKQLINSIFKQKGAGYTLEKLIVFSDGSNDATDAILKTIKDKRLKLISAKKTRGFAYGVETIIKHTDSEALVLFNDDVLLADNYVVSRLVTPFRDPRVGVVSGKIVPLPPQTFIEKAVYSSFKAYSKLKMLKREGNNLFTCDGKVLGLSKSFRNNIKLTVPEAGNVDVYIYFLCLAQNFSYRYVNVDSILFRLPQTASDLFNQTRRAYISNIFMFKKFGSLARSEFTLPKSEVSLSLLKELMSNPLGSLALVVINRFIVPLTLKTQKSFTTWSLAKSTKNIRI